MPIPASLRLGDLALRPALLGLIALGGFAFVLPIILANVPYMDDGPRMMNGYGWIKSGRPLATLLMTSLGFRTRNMADLAPLGQLLGVAALALGAWVFATRLCGARGLFWPFLCAMPVMVQPFFLENLSYRYDCLPMSLAQGLAFATPAMFGVPRGRNGMWFALCTLAILCLYQVALASLIAACVLLFIGACRTGDAAQPGVLIRRIGLSLVVLIGYRLAVAPFLRGSYTQAHSRSILHNPHAVLTTLHHTLALLGRVGVDAMAVVIYAPIIAACLACLRLALCLPWKTGIFLVASPLVLLACLPGVNALLEDAVIEPRTLMGFSGLAVLAPLLLAERNRIGRVAACLSLGACLTLSFAYGNALHEKGRFDDAQASALADRLWSLGFEPGDQVVTIGAAPTSPAVRNAEAIFPLLRALLPRDPIGDDGFFCRARLQRAGLSVSDHVDIATQRAFVLTREAHPLYRDARYAVYGERGLFAVEFSRGPR